MSDKELENQQHQPVDDEELLANAIPIDESNLDEDEDGTDASAQAHQPELDVEEELTPIEIEEDEDDEEDEEARARRRKIQSLGERQWHEEKPWKRQPNTTGKGAVHVKTFVAKLRLDAIEHMDEQINDWLEQHPEYEVKFTTVATGPLKGKLTEDALFLSVWV